MIALIQRVAHASVSIDGQLTGQIGRGLLVLLGITHADTTDDVQWLSRKLVPMRLFADPDGKMNLSVADTGGEILLVSQFTLHASTKKGNRPSFIEAARPEHARPLYEAMIAALGQHLGKPVATGMFGADMAVQLLNDGPVTIILDSRNRI